jgi:hypothetical protein
VVATLTRGLLPNPILVQASRRAKRREAEKVKTI